jgi:hypothetical protein
MNSMHKLYTCGSDRQPTFNAGNYFIDSNTLERSHGVDSPTGATGSPRDYPADAHDAAWLHGGACPDLEALIEPKPRLSSCSGAVSAHAVQRGLDGALAESCFLMTWALDRTGGGNGELADNPVFRVRVLYSAFSMQLTKTRVVIDEGTLVFA